VGATYTQNLTLGSSGASVSALQQFLINGGFLKISSATGYFGPLTKTALGAWQASVGISPSTGYFGPVSRSKINTTAPQAPTVMAPAQSTAPAQSVVTTTTTTVATSTPVATNNGSPVRLTIPKLNVSAGFQFNGTAADGTIEIPTNVTDVGWYIHSPRPGEKGNSIVTGHVAQIRRSVVTKQGVFYNLNTLQPGDTLFVLNDKGESIAFVVRESRLYDPTADATDVFNSRDGGAHLVLITCEGTWNQAQLEYTQRLVVFADLVQ
jgi:LPXTG-site transpeptidase (sortase) family protein